MNYHCPNISCRFYQSPEFVIKNGKFRRLSDARFVQKLKCTHCGKQFSSATFTPEKYQKKRRINFTVLKALSSGLSIRRIALNLNVNTKTIERRVNYLAKKCERKNKKFLKSIRKNPIQRLQIDDLITCEHTKMKPLSITCAVDAERRYLLCAEVSQIPAFGLLAKKSVKKYGYRKSTHRQAMHSMSKKVAPLTSTQALIQTDQHQIYPEFIRKYFKGAIHEAYPGGRGSVVGQGELKKLNFDPLFTVNHTCAMLRENINRLKRKTWSTTKDPFKLKQHLEIFIYYYNQIYLKDYKT
jgi:transposase-like protein